jgi:hypothetical protein
LGKIILKAGLIFHCNFMKYKGKRNCPYIAPSSENIVPLKRAGAVAFSEIK